MSDDENEKEGSALLAAIIALAFASNTLIALIRTVPTKEHEAIPFVQGFLEYAPIVWGVVFGIILTVVVWIVATEVIYYITHGLRDDVQGWLDR